MLLRYLVGGAPILPQKETRQQTPKQANTGQKDRGPLASNHLQFEMALFPGKLAAVAYPFSVKLRTCRAAGFQTCRVAGFQAGPLQCRRQVWKPAAQQTWKSALR
jgi:hypothetical protein